jgi:hypothetical protein
MVHASATALRICGISEPQRHGGEVGGVAMAHRKGETKGTRIKTRVNQEGK